MFQYHRYRSSAILTILLAAKFPFDNDAVKCGIFLIATTATTSGEWFPHDHNEYDLFTTILAITAIAAILWKQKSAVGVML